MIDKNKLMKERAARLSVENQPWALDWGIIKDDEEIVVTLSTRRKNSIPQLTPDELGNLKLLEFFTRERFYAAGVETKINFIRIYNAFIICQDAALVKEYNKKHLAWLQYIHIPRVEALLPLSRRTLRTISQMGNKTIDVMDAVLAHYDLYRYEKRPK